jgi:hypothetical protein
MTAQVGLTNGSTLIEDITIDETCPEIGAGSLAFGFEVLEKINPIKYTNATGMAWTGSTSSTNYAFTILAAVSQSYTTGDYTNKYPQKFGINVNAPRDTNSFLLEYPLKYYDATSTKDVGGVMVFNGTTYVYPGNWSASWHSETGLLQAVLAANITGLYTNFLKTQTGTWHDTGTYHPAKTLYFDSVNWIFNGGKYFPHTDTWNGEWIGLTGNYALYSSDGTGVRTVQTQNDTLKDKLLTNERELNVLRWLVGNIGQRILIPDIINTGDGAPSSDPGANKEYVIGLKYTDATTDFQWKVREYAAPGGVTPTVYSKSFADSPYTLADTSGIIMILVNATGGNCTINLPTAVSNTALVMVKKTDATANTVTIDAFGAQTIDTSATKVLSRQYEAVSIFSDNANWQVDDSYSVDPVHLSGTETITGAKTFSTIPTIPDEAYTSAWNGKLEPTTKNAVYDKIETVINIPYTQSSFTVPTETGRLQIYQLTMASTDTATLEGTATLKII